MKRLNIYLQEPVKEYVESESKKMGLTQSAFIVMCINKYKEEKESLVAIERFVRVKGDKM